MNKKYNISLNFLKILAILLIINSHADILYPSKIKFFATGGSIGNELFFLISGYLFNRKNDISADIKKRFIKLYLPTYIIIIITIIIGRLTVDSIIGAIKIFIWPTAFWFVGAIFIYSIILYALIKLDIIQLKRFLIFGFCIASLDLLLYLFLIPDKSIWIVEDAYFAFIPYRSLYSLFSFILGYFLKVNKEKLFGKINEIQINLLAIASFVAFYGFKFLLNKNIIPMSLQILSHPITIICALFVFLAFAQIDLNKKFEDKRMEYWINLLANLSLESYLVQFIIIAEMSSLNIIFPINIILCVVIIMFIAWILHFVSIRLSGMIFRK